jgi:hypothetical protein
MPKRHFTLDSEQVIDPYAEMVDSSIAVEDTPAYFLSVRNHDTEETVRVGTLPDGVSDTEGDIVGPLGEWDLNITAGNRYAFTGDAGSVNADVWCIIITDTE